MDIKNKNELHTHQDMDSRQMQKVNCYDKKVLGEHSTPYIYINIVINVLTYMH